MRSVSAVSCQSQIIARIETSGSDAISPPKPGLRLRDLRDGHDDDPGQGRFDQEVGH